MSLCERWCHGDEDRHLVAIVKTVAVMTQDQFQRWSFCGQRFDNPLNTLFVGAKVRIAFSRARIDRNLREWTLSAACCCGENSDIDIVLEFEESGFCDKANLTRFGTSLLRRPSSLILDQVREFRKDTFGCFGDDRGYQVGLRREAQIFRRH